MMRQRTPPKQVWICRTHDVEFVDYDDHAYCTTVPTTGSRMTVQRCCNGCGCEIGDMSALEGQCAVEGWPLPDVRGECRHCAVDTAELLDDAKRPHAGTLTRPDGTTIDVRFVPTATRGQFIAVTVDGDSVVARDGDTMTIDLIGPEQSILYRVDPGVTP